MAGGRAAGSFMIVLGMGLPSLLQPAVRGMCQEQHSALNLPYQGSVCPGS